MGKPSADVVVRWRHHVNISEKKVEWLLGLQYRFRHSKSLDRERRTLAMRNGFVTENEMTLEAVGKEVDVTREHIRQIEAKAYRKLRREILCNKKLKVEDYSGELLADA